MEYADLLKHFNSKRPNNTRNGPLNEPFQGSNWFWFAMKCEIYF